MRTLPLTAKAYATLDSNGDGTASTGPVSPGEVWSGLTVGVSVATNTHEAQCLVYAGAAPTPGYFGDGTLFGSTGNSTQNVGTVRVGGNVFAVWTGGDPGARATMVITGTRQVA
jgi:hypothetical protein